MDPNAFRHSTAAGVARRAIYRLLVGDPWPPTLRAIRDEPIAPLASSNVYVHLPFCESRCPHCPYTAFVAGSDRRAAYGAALRREIARYLELANAPAVSSLYFGGGTPSLTPELVEAVLSHFRERLTPAAEVGVEVHPRDAQPSLLRRLREAGATRVSLGIETLDPALLRLLGRRYTPEQALETIDAARRIGFECVDANLIFGIPGQTPDQAERDAERVMARGVDQISAYPLFSFAYTPMGRALAERKISPASDRSRLEAQRRISAACRRHGLERTSVWSFTRRGIAPYSTVTRDSYVGFGVGAGSHVDGELRFNTFSLGAYISADGPAATLRLVPSERFRRVHWIYWQIYKTALDPRHYRAVFARDLERDWRPWLDLLRFLGLARRSNDGGVWRLTERGAIWVHRAQALFSLAYIDELWSRARLEPYPSRVELR